jgi:hypothetical protein
MKEAHTRFWGGHGAFDSRYAGKVKGQGAAAATSWANFPRARGHDGQLSAKVCPICASCFGFLSGQIARLLVIRDHAADLGANGDELSPIASSNSEMGVVGPSFSRTT